MDAFNEKGLKIISDALQLTKKKSLHIVGACELSELRFLSDRINEITFYESRESLTKYLERSREKVISRSQQKISVEEIIYECNTPTFNEKFKCFYFTNTGLDTFHQELWSLRLIEANIDCVIVTIEHPLFSESSENCLGSGNLRAGGKLAIYQYNFNARSRESYRKKIHLKMKEIFQNR